MTILQMTTDFAGQVGIKPRLVRILVTDGYQNITTPGFFNPITMQGLSLLPNDILFINYNNGNNFGLFFMTIFEGIITIHPFIPQGLAQQIFTSSGTYVPNPNLVLCKVEAVGGGGGGGGAPVTGSNQGSMGGGGGGAQYSVDFFSAATIGASQSVTIGSGGIGVTSNPGTDGGQTIFGALSGVTGGAGGSTGIAVGTNNFEPGGFGGTGAGGLTVRFPGNAGNYGLRISATSSAIGGKGGAAGNGFGGGGPSTVATNGSVAGNNALPNSGAGGGGAAAATTPDVARAGGNGGSGVVIITEYLSI